MFIKSILRMVVLVSFSSCIVGCSSSGVRSVSLEATEVDQYELLVVDVDLRADWESPFSSSDVALNAHISTPSGKKIVLPGFYVDGESGSLSSWRINFAPREVGQYEMTVVLEGQGVGGDSARKVMFESRAGDRKGYLHGNDLWTLQFDNGELFRGLGINYGWEPRDEDDSKHFSELHEDSRFEYQNFIPKIKGEGVNLIRTWMIYWNLPVDWKTVKNASRYADSSDRFNRSGIERMDDLIGLAESNDIYIMLVLDSHAGFIGDGWRINPYNKKNGGVAETPEEFFSSELARNHYKDKLRYMVARWGYSTKIAAWELFNEVDNIIYADEENRIPDQVVTEWHREMSDYLASIDPYDHVITTSVSHRDVSGLNSLENINVNQRHMYKVTDQIPDTLRRYTDDFDKPYVIGEFGYEWDWQLDFDEFRDEKVQDFKKGLWYGVFSPTPVLPMSWWWEYFDEQGALSYLSCVKEINDHVLSTASGSLRSESVSVENKALTAMGISNGEKRFVYVGNHSDSRQEVSLRSILGNKGNSDTVHRYECHSNKGSYSRIDAPEAGSEEGLYFGANTNVVFIIDD
ncbi:DUF5060 domain-containing protein [Marinimicrobium sp. C6131]|uniref:DUF5060 domain-containing protein n=1 Tax=Marinimicrobium sp. C6131 TaxID=3022676 RepID=UPI00223DC959|nr:DUF5060 domain-containing protein [Marinimicrobium sp. C6131]UZJ44704.1 DUF5060 domain-containing protein [Marinimicrobium sp. C6131]